MTYADEKAARANALFQQGYNCAQAVFAAFAQEMGMDEKLALRLSGALGGGMGGLREVCGAASSMFAVIGAIRGYDEPDQRAKEALYARIQALGDVFRRENDSLICRELLAAHGITPGHTPAVRTEAYYQQRPCPGYVEQCARWTAEALEAEA